MVVPPPCNCLGIVGALNYEAGYIKGYEDGRKAKASFEQNNQETPPPQRTPYKTNPYVDPYPYGGNNRTQNADLISVLILGWMKFFPEFGFGLNNQFAADKFKNIGGQFFGRHDFESGKLRCNLEISSYAYPQMGGLCIGMDYNFNQTRPFLNRTNFKGSVLNPYIGLSMYFFNNKNDMSFCGALGFDYWIKERNPTGRAGFGMKYIIGTKNTNMVQFSLLCKITKF
jgi:hypothetical protein